MSFIAIDAKADISYNEVNESLPHSTQKKGKLTPAQHAQINAWCLAKKTGIFDYLGKCEYDTNLTNLIPQDGNVTVFFKKGYVAICGRIVECEAGTKVEINTNEMPNGKIVLRYDLRASKDEEFKVVVVSQSTILEQNDLNENTENGVYEFELYSYSLSGSSIVLTRSNTEYIKDISSKIDDIEERLTKMGFSEGVVGGDYEKVANSSLKAQGTFCIFNWRYSGSIRQDHENGVYPLITFDPKYAPKEDTAIAVSYKYKVNMTTTKYYGTLLVKAGEGGITIQLPLHLGWDLYSYSDLIILNAGWERKVDW